MSLSKAHGGHLCLSGQLVKADLTDALGVHTTRAQHAMRRVFSVMVAEDILAQAAVMAGHGSLGADDHTQALAAAGEGALVPASPFRSNHTLKPCSQSTTFLPPHQFQHLLPVRLRRKFG